MFRRKQREQDLHDELSAYLKELTARRIAAGEDPETARREALVEAGGIEQVKEACRDVRRLNWLDVMALDIRYGLRTMRRNVNVTVIAVLSLGLGIGVNALIFSFINALILTALPYREPDRLVMVGATAPDAPDNLSSLTQANCTALAGASAFESFGCYVDSHSVSLAEDRQSTLPADRLLGQPVSAALARTFGVSPLIGRWFTDEEERNDADRVIVIGHGVWQRRFGGSPDVLGKVIRLDGEPTTIIGVMPNEFHSIDSRAEYWMPWRDTENRSRASARMFRGVGRLKSGDDLQRVQSEMDAFALSLGETSETYNGWGIAIRPLGRVLRGGLNSGDFWALISLQGTVAFGCCSRKGPRTKRNYPSVRHWARVVGELFVS
jgi:hypothetical protein